MRRFVKIFFVTLLVWSSSIFCLTSETLAQIQQKQNGQEKFLKTKDSIPNRYIVVFNEDEQIEKTVGQDDLTFLAQSMAGAYGGKVEHIYSSALKGFSIEMPEKEALALSKDARVKYVVEDGIVYGSATQNNAPWGLDRIDQWSRPLSGTYSYNFTGIGVKAYVIDSGILPTHVEFGGRATIGADFVGDGQNGLDCHGHGTHVSGTLAGKTYGVAKRASVIAVRVLNCSNSGTLSGLIAGVNWVQANKVLPAVANMSLSGGANQAVDDAVRNLIASGVTVVIAAGNNSGNDLDANNISPARVREAITVGATDINDFRAGFSNIGSAVDVFAPGVNITSAWNNGGTNTISGTSMATPHVAGVVAQYLQLNPGSSPAQAQSVIAAFSTKGVVANPGAGSPNQLLFSQINNPSCGLLLADKGLTKGQSVTSCNGAVTLVFQTAGNVVLYKNTGANAGQALWYTNLYVPVDPNANYFVMQRDGNLVLYAANGAAMWYSKTWGNPGAYLAVQNDSNVVIYSSSGIPLWHSETWGR